MNRKIWFEEYPELNFHLIIMSITVSDTLRSEWYYTFSWLTLIF